MILKADSDLVSQILPSPNFGERIAGSQIDMVLLHYTGMADAQSALQRLQDQAFEVSAHYVVCEDGAIVQMVAERARAWHAGSSFWQGVRDINSVSIGIEIINGGHDYALPAYPKYQIDAVIALCLDLKQRYDIPTERFLGHSDVAPQRKEDPGELFPWPELAKHGLGHWISQPQDILCDEDAGVGLFSRMGFDVAGQDHVKMIEAFQRHFRPAHINGQLDAQTLSLLAQYAPLYEKKP